MTLLIDVKVVSQLLSVMTITSTLTVKSQSATQLLHRMIGPSILEEGQMSGVVIRKYHIGSA